MNRMDSEMESCVSTTAVEILEDPDSRDSGISMARTISLQSSCSQGTLITAIDNVDISGKHFEENYDNENAIDDEIYQRFYRSPLKKRMRSCEKQLGPTDFSCLHQRILGRLSEDEESSASQPPSPKILPTRSCFQPPHSSISNENWIGSSSLSASQGNHFSSSTSFTSNNSSNTLIASNGHLDHSTFLIDHDHIDKNIPPSARSIQRVHSASVLEYSRDKSWGSPDAFEHYSLRTVERPQTPHRAFRSISADTLVSLLESMDEEQFLKRFILIDCRYPYEFEGGHIWYSLNVWESKEIEKIFFPDEEEKFEEMRQRIPIFYCEFSQKRGPKMALELRGQDRNRNESRYPYVDYREVYLLDRGYKHFFEACQMNRFCSPQSYVRMWDSAFADERKRYDGHRRVKKRRRN